MSTVTIYLHIGASKTGSTALQRFLEQNFSELLKFGVLYPNFRDKDVFTPMLVGQNYWHGYYFDEFDSSHDLALFNKCIQYCKENSLHSIVISNESFLVNWRDRLGQLAGSLDANVKIICYVRRQDYFSEAAWKQWGHKFFSANELFSSLGRQEWGGWGVMDWYQAIAPWSRNFGKENIIIQPYEKEQMPDGILPDFLNKIGITWPEKPVLKEGIYVNINNSFSRDVLEFLYLNKDFHGEREDYRMYNMVNNVLRDDFRKKVFDAYGVLSPKDRIALLEKYEASNQNLALEYLDRADGRLFYEPWPDPNENWEPYEGLTVEKLTPILTKLIHYVYEREITLNSKYATLIEQQRNLIEQHQALHERYSLRGMPKRLALKLLRLLRLKK